MFLTHRNGVTGYWDPTLSCVKIHFGVEQNLIIDWGPWGGYQFLVWVIKPDKIKLSLYNNVISWDPVIIAGVWDACQIGLSIPRRSFYRLPLHEPGWVWEARLSSAPLRLVEGAGFCWMPSKLRAVCSGEAQPSPQWEPGGQGRMELLLWVSAM